MADDNSPQGPDVAFDFDLPNGIDSEAEESGGNLQQRDNPAESYSAVMTDLLDDGTVQRRDSDHEINYRQFSPGFSDDEPSGKVFEQSWPSHQTNKQAAKAAKGKKSPRRSEWGHEDSELHVRAKRPRQALIDSAGEETKTDEQVDNLLVPQTPGHSLGHCMFGLNLEQQQDDDEVAELTNNDSGLACSDIGSVRDSPAPSDDDLEIPPDTVVS